MRKCFFGFFLRQNEKMKKTTQYRTFCLRHAEWKTSGFFPLRVHTREPDKDRITEKNLKSPCEDEQKSGESAQYESEQLNHAEFLAGHVVDERVYFFRFQLKD